MIQTAEPHSNIVNLNSRVARLLQESDQRLLELRVTKSIQASGAMIYDFGVNTKGSLEAGLLLSRVCLADLAQVQIVAPNLKVTSAPILQVTTDHAWLACMASQYAGWPVKTDEYFAMASGPMRIKRRKEKILEELNVEDRSNVVVGVLESEQLPDAKTVAWIANECGVQPQQVILCVAPTTSLAGTVQIVARSIETALHKIHTLGGNVKSIESAIGWAPIPTPGKKFVAALGRTNDAILYCSHVALWCQNDEQFMSLIDQIPSSASKDFGKPFAEIFAACEHDFYKIDAGLFAPAMITIHGLSSGKTVVSGQLPTNWSFL